VHASVYHKNFNLLLPIGYFMMQSWLLLLLSNDDDDRLIKEEENLTPRHLHAHVYDELQNVPDCMYWNFDGWQNWTTTVVDRFLWIMGPFFLSHPSLYGSCWLNERRNTILLSFYHFHFFSLASYPHIYTYTCQFMVKNTDVNLENLQL